MDRDKYRVVVALFVLSFPFVDAVAKVRGRAPADSCLLVAMYRVVKQRTETPAPNRSRSRRGTAGRGTMAADTGLFSLVTSWVW